MGEVDNFIRYYSHNQTGNALGEINVGSVIDVRYVKGDKGPKECPYGFQITTADKVYYLYAESVAQRQRWCDGLNVRVELLKTQNGNSFFASTPVPHTPIPQSSPNDNHVTQHNNNNVTTTPNSNNRAITWQLNRSHSHGHLNNNDITVCIDNNGNPVIGVQPAPALSAMEVATINNYKKERSAKIRVLRKTDSFTPNSLSRNIATARGGSGSGNVNGLVSAMPARGTVSGGGGSGSGLNVQTSHRRKKSCGKLQDDISEYVEISMWMQNRDKEQKGVDKLAPNKAVKVEK